MKTRTGVNGIAALGAMGTALAAGGMPVAALAQNGAMAGGTTLSFEGGLAFSNFTSDFVPDDFEDKFGEVDLDLGHYGSVGISKQISQDWDWRASASTLGLRRNPFVDVSEEEIELDAGIQHGALFLDFDIGRTWQGPEGSARIGAGLEALSFEQTLDKGLTVYDPDTFDLVGTGDFYLDQDFRGLGPRISADFTHKLGGSSSAFRLIGGASLAVFRANATATKGIEIISEEENFFEEETFEGNSRFVHGAAFLGMAFDKSENQSFKFGLRIDHFDDDGDGRGDDPGLIDSPVNIGTAFVGMDVKF